MSACNACSADLPPGIRWCPICHASAVSSIDGHLASPGKRLGAYFLDFGIPIFAIVMIASTAAALGSGGFFMLLLLGYIVWALMLFSKGTTPGKNLLGMRVIDERGQRASFGKMFVREWIGKFISGFILGLGYIWILLDRDRQGWHDKLVSTYVVE